MALSTPDSDWKRSPLHHGVVRGLLILALAGLSTGCIIERDPPEEDEGDEDEPLTVPPYGEALRVVETFPADGAVDVPLDTRLYVTFDQYLDGDSLLFFDTLRVGSSGIRAAELSSYSLVDKRVRARLTRALEPEVVYALMFNQDALRSVDGSPLQEPPEVLFRTGEALAREYAEAPEPPTWAEDVEPLIARGCSCHRLEAPPPTWFDIPYLGYDQLVGRPSWSRPSRLLVEPYRADRSVLMHKLLADYPIRVGTEMPPPWAEGDPAYTAVPLSLEELRLVERWIDTGAAR